MNSFKQEGDTVRVGADGYSSKVWGTDLKGCGDQIRNCCNIPMSDGAT